MNRPLRITTIVLGTVLGLWFLLAGSQKFFAAPMFQAMFGHLGLPLVMVPLVGVAEVVGGLLALWPRTSLYGATLIGVIMLGAVGSHLIAGGMPPGAALLALLLSAGLAVLRRRALQDGVAR